MLKSMQIYERFTISNLPFPSVGVTRLQTFSPVSTLHSQWNGPIRRSLHLNTKLRPSYHPGSGGSFLLRRTKCQNTVDLSSVCPFFTELTLKARWPLQRLVAGKCTGTVWGQVCLLWRPVGHKSGQGGVTSQHLFHTQAREGSGVGTLFTPMWGNGYGSATCSHIGDWGVMGRQITLL